MILPHPVQFAIGLPFAAATGLGLWFGFYYDEQRTRTSRRDNPIEFWFLVGLFALNAVIFGAYGLGGMDR